ncbi:MAG: TonB-dependent receptor [Erythrobacter sp.]|nr:TonB-dependent receptor [Erythrobacter sp.]MBA4081659.1 TonB-dependent receptor [Erythrobacter sp.]
MHAASFRSLIRCGAAVWLMGAAGLCLPASAQEAPASSTPSSEAAPSDMPAPDANTRSTFTPEDFARFAPRTALDMARQVPGFAIRDTDDARGLGQADTNVLINGRRISGKSNGPVEALQRIPLDDVVRLEVVDGASLDIGGLSGQVLNVVTRSTGRITGQFRVAPQFRTRGTPAQLLDGRIGIAGGGAKTEWNLSLDNDSNRRGDEGPERVFNAAGQLIETREEKSNFNSDLINLSGSFTRKADNGNILNLTGEVEALIFSETERSAQTGLVTPEVRNRLFRRTEDSRSFELGGDYQFTFGPGQLKLIGFYGLEDTPEVANVLTEFADGRAPTGSRFISDTRSGETIARGEYTLAALGGNLVAAIEGARNFLEIDAELAVRDGAGVLQPTPLPGASARVDEDRIDGGLTYSRALASNLQFQGSLGAEFSRISQSGAFGLSRQFFRPKGFVSLDWKARDGVNLAGRIERVVGQLEFDDFLAGVDLDQDREDGSNGALVPPQSWMSELELSLNLGALGKANLRGFYEDITDIVDQIPLPGGGQAVGNIPSAQRYGIGGDITLLSDGLGWKGTRFDLRFALQDSRVRDPLLTTPRELSGNERVNLRGNLRHDFADKVWAVGGMFDWMDFTPVVRLDEVSRRSQTFGFASVFVENKDVAGLTVRGMIGNLLDRRNKFDRTVFADRAAGLASFSESRRRSFGQIVTLEIEGTF